ncbi:helix-turn-helix domain-containing protein [Nocardioides humilatus]|uniref:Helix-turn-helix domain-containing protein n=1 Tax=Nocardioides humilatus TaxID=2607660 RepID=A0A5B1LFX3_9ACTN|nr:helix-turn-helix transcriptional regulator [Nocardioides humilatus]KAA1419244.1 helix-turn-helix domain-containing protein [Nocardioides humilatus]
MSITATHHRAAPGPTRPTSLADYRARTATRAAGRASAAELHTAFAAASVPGPAYDFHPFVASVLARADRVEPVDHPEWERFLGLLDRHRTNAKAAINCGVLANLVGIAAFGDATDFLALADLSDRLGADRLAAIQHRAARFIEPDATFPLTTIAITRMIGSSGHPAARGSLDSAVKLLATGVDPDRYLPVIRTPAELLGLVDGGSVLEWRHHLAVIAASPWSPYARHLGDLAGQIARPQAAEVIDRFTELCREQNKEAEREQVANEVRRLVAESGATQRQFAQWVGTSASRLSTYVSGSVTPSASLMLRMTRTSRLLQERDVPLAPSAGSEQSWGAARASADGGDDGSTGPGERAPGALGRRRSHLSAV